MPVGLGDMAVWVSGGNTAPTVSSTNVGSLGTINEWDAAVTLTVTGTNFVASSVVRVNDVDMPTTYNSSTSLSARVRPGTSGCTSGAARSIKVYNPSPGGGTATAADTITFTAVTMPPTTNQTGRWDNAHLTTSGGNVTVAVDQSGNSRDLANSNTIPYSASESTFGNNPAADLPGTNSKFTSTVDLKTFLDSGSTDYICFCVAKVDTIDNTPTLSYEYDSLIGNARASMHLKYVDASNGKFFTRTYDGAHKVTADITFSLATAHVFMLRRAAAGAHYARVDLGTEQGIACGSTIFVTGGDKLMIGGGDFTTGTADCKIAAAVTYSAAVSATTQDRITRWIAWTYAALDLF